MAMRHQFLIEACNATSMAILYPLPLQSQWPATFHPQV